MLSVIYPIEESLRAVFARRGRTEYILAVNPDEYTGISSPADEDGHHAVNALKESEVWEDEIYQIEKNDLLAGGEKGLANLQAQQLANRTAWLKNKTEEIGKSKKKIENILLGLYAEQEAKSLSPDGHLGILVENFTDDAPEIDKTTVDVTDVAVGKNTANALNIAALIPGAHYVLTDKKVAEEVQLISIDSMAEENTPYLLTFAAPVKNAYQNEKTMLCRSTIEVSNGMAKGTSTATDKISRKCDFNGITRKDMNKSLDFDNLSAFKITGGARVKDGKLVVEKNIAYGIVLATAGGGTGVWTRVNGDGEDLKDSDLT